jgi:hypothetical protein
VILERSRSALRTRACAIELAPARGMQPRSPRWQSVRVWCVWGAGHPGRWISNADTVSPRRPWAYVVLAAVMLLFPLNTRYQMRALRRKLVARNGDVARFDQFLHSRSLHALYVVVPICGAVLIVVAAAAS